MSGQSSAWSWRMAIAESDLKPVTRHVLLTISLHMNEKGEGCYPSQELLAAETGLSRKAVNEHLSKAIEGGWLLVEKHGLKGRRWNRNEYRAAWPGRDEATEEAAQGCNGGLQPHEGDEAVTVAPGGSNPDGAEAVTEGYTNSPENISENSPERASARERDLADENREKEELPQSREQLERRFWKLVKTHPQSAGVPKNGWLAEWMKLTADERDRAERRHGAWLALLKANSKSHTPALSTYFAQKLFDEVADPQAEAEPTTIEARPFGPLWGGLVVRALLGEAKAAPRPPSQFIADLIARNDDAGRAERLRRRMQFGWPGVNEWYRQAENRRGFAAGATDGWIADLCEPVPVDSPLIGAWKAEFDHRGWPWLPDWGGMKVVWLPKGGPQGLRAFEEAVQEAVSRQANGDGKQEAVSREANGDEGQEPVSREANGEAEQHDDDDVTQAAE